MISVLEILSTLFVDFQLCLGCLEALADRLGQAVDPLPQWINLIHRGERGADVWARSSCCALDDSMARA